MSHSRHANECLGEGSSKPLSSQEPEIHRKCLFPNPQMEGGPLLNSGHCVTSDSKQALSPGAEERHSHISLDISTFLQNHCLGSLILRWKTASLGLPPGGASGPHSDAHKRKLNISSRQTTQRCILMSE